MLSNPRISSMKRATFPVLPTFNKFSTIDLVVLIFVLEFSSSSRFWISSSVMRLRFRSCSSSSSSPKFILGSVRMLLFERWALHIFRYLSLMEMIPSTNLTMFSRDRKTSLLISWSSARIYSESVPNIYFTLDLKFYSSSLSLSLSSSLLQRVSTISLNLGFANSFFLLIKSPAK